MASDCLHEPVITAIHASSVLTIACEQGQGAMMSLDSDVGQYLNAPYAGVGVDHLAIW